MIIRLAFAAPALAAAAAHAQCTEKWFPQTGAADLNNLVVGATTWDPPGPQDDLLIFGGWFTSAGGNPANHVAAWDGQAWSALDSGTTGKVYALAVYGGDLITGGSFASAGGVLCANIARWDGAAWHPLGSGT